MQKQAKLLTRNTGQRRQINFCSCYSDFYETRRKLQKPIAIQKQTRKGAAKISQISLRKYYLKCMGKKLRDRFSRNTKFIIMISTNETEIIYEPPFRFPGFHVKAGGKMQ